MPGMTEGHHYSELPAQRRRAASELAPPPDDVNKHHPVIIAKIQVCLGGWERTHHRIVGVGRDP